MNPIRPVIITGDNKSRLCNSFKIIYIELCDDNQNTGKLWTGDLLEVRSNC